MKKALVFDFGASSARAIIVRYDDSNFISDEIYRFSNTPVTVNGTLYWDIDYLLDNVKTAMLKACEKGFDTVSADTWGVDFAILDENGGFIERPVHYRDNRTRAVIDEVNSLFGGERSLYLKTGIQPAWFNTIYQLFALKRIRPESLEKGRFLMMPDIFCHFLTGEMHNEYSEATTTSLLSPESKSWDKDILSKLGFPTDIFRDILYSGDIYGYVKPEFLTGKMSGRKIPVICVPSHDTASAITAAPAEEKEFVFISTGTWALFGTELEKPVITSEAYRAGLSNEGGHDGTTAFLKNIMGMWLLQEFRRELKKSDYSIGFPEMEKLAESAEPLKYFIDPNDDRFSAPDDMPRRISDYICASGQGEVTDNAALLRAVYDSLAAEFACTLDDIERISGKRFEKVYMFGGGTKDKLLCSLTAKYTGRRVIAGPTEATALGNAVSALIGIGAIENTKKAREIILSSGMTVTYEPKEDISEAIKAKYKTAILKK